MRTAVIFSGFFRTFEVTKESCMDNLIKPLHADVFFSAPHTAYAPPAHEVSEFHDMHSQNAKTIDSFIDYMGDHVKFYEIRDYNGVMYRDKISDLHMPEKNMFNQYHWRILSQMHAVSQSVCLFKKYTEMTRRRYDLVILTRPDLKYYTTFNHSSINRDRINYPLHSVCNGNVGTVSANPSPSLDHPFNDQIIIGTQDQILAYSDIYDKVLGYVNDEKIIFNPETIFGYHARKKGIQFDGTDCVLYEILRKES